MAIFYRVLTSREALLRWLKKDFTASHCLLPGDWMDLYRKGERNPNSYSLIVRGCPYLKTSLHAFLNFSQLYGPSGVWAREHLCAASEIDGVFAWCTPELALDYALEGGGHPVAVFEGDRTGDTPEIGGACARVVKEIEILLAIDFQKKYFP